MKEQSQRQLRVAQQIRHEIVRLLQHGGFDDPLLADSGSITVTEVSMSPDLKNARAYVVHLGDETIGKDLLAALNTVAPMMQGKIARALQMRATPRLRFDEDTSFKTAHRLNDILANLPPAATE